MAQIEVFFENIPSNLHAEAKRYVTEIREVLRMSFTHSWGAEYRQKWFGQRDTVRVLNMLASIDKYLNEKCTRITLVREAGDHYGSVWPTIMVDNESTADYQRGDGYLRVPAGLRIGIASSYDNPETESKGGKSGLYTVPLQRMNTIFHEITHKVLHTDDVVYPGTNDECYGDKLCKKLSHIHPDLAINNADNWGFYLAECFKHVFGNK